MAPMLRRLNKALTVSKSAGEMQRDEEAGDLWHDVYGPLTGERLGLFGAVTSRAEAQVLRLSCVYALLDCSTTVALRHLTAALAVWEYCDESARFVFGDSVGERTADTILQALRANAYGLTRQEINEKLFGKNKRSEEISRALRVLAEHSLARAEEQRDTGGRPSEKWIAIGFAQKAAAQ
jgi:hypothetical protein